MYKSNEVVTQCIYVTVVVESEFGLCYWGFAQRKKVRVLYIHTYVLLYTYVTTPQVLRLHQP